MVKNISRREAIRGGGVGLLGLLSGCGTVRLQHLSGECKKPDLKGRYQIQPAIGESLSISQKISERKSFDQYKYIESNDTVRYVSAYSGDDVLDYGFMSWEKFADMKAAQHAREAVRRIISSELGREVGNVEVNAPKTHGQYPIIVSLITKTDDECVVSTPSVHYRDVRIAAPEMVTSEVILDGHSQTNRLKVGVQKKVHEGPKPT